jgi:hypothetical protein
MNNVIAIRRMILKCHSIINIIKFEYITYNINKYSYSHDDNMIIFNERIQSKLNELRDLFKLIKRSISKGSYDQNTLNMISKYLKILLNMIFSIDNTIQIDPITFKITLPH